MATTPSQFLRQTLMSFFTLLFLRYSNPLPFVNLFVSTFKIPIFFILSIYSHPSVLFNSIPFTLILSFYTQKMNHIHPKHSLRALRWPTRLIKALHHLPSYYLSYLTFYISFSLFYVAVLTLLFLKHIKDVPNSKLCTLCFFWNVIPLDMYLGLLPFLFLTSN